MGELNIIGPKKEDLDVLEKRIEENLKEGDPIYARVGCTGDEIIGFFESYDSKNYIIYCRGEKKYNAVLGHLISRDINTITVLKKINLESI
ncbi:MAG: hypothetical protein JSW73_02640 [Candidatus Woesearchaeota archaeon]|nr:MAG: hypothetical protein JSW73_02640 [Candidatus Woesearchaeota archaeon]